MVSIRKLSIEDFKTIKSILNKHNITSDRIILNLKEFTVETEDDNYNLTDLLTIPGKITRERADELLKHIQTSRQSWDR